MFSRYSMWNYKFLTYVGIVLPSYLTSDQILTGICVEHTPNAAPFQTGDLAPN